jgi:eukaryotic-like serine/threonine-protein kinase
VRRESSGASRRSSSSAFETRDHEGGCLERVGAPDVGVAMPGKVILDVTHGPLQGKRFAFEEHDTFVFGRARDCHACLSAEDTTASRHHFLLEVNPPDARIRDLGSRNGTYVNETKHGGRGENETPEEAAKRRYPEVDLKHGDVVRVGGTIVGVRVEMGAGCGDCGANIPDAFRSVYSWVGGTYLCPECREKAAKGKAPAVPTPPTCSQCGRDVAAEVGERRGGAYVCNACRAGAERDPAVVLAQALAVRSQQRGEAVPIGVAGYRLGKVLGRGGMGAVYLADRISDGEKVALKVMLAKVAVDEQARQLFQREIEVLRSLKHGNIVALFEHGSAGGAFYFVMELCPGGSLQDLMQMRGRPMDTREAGPLMLEVLAGLGHAHAQGFVHRDLKPANILLAPKNGGAKVSDFGFAKNFEKAGLSGMTKTGTAAGTYPFMAREQLINYRDVKPASDVWSIGATFYFLLTAFVPRDKPPDRDPLDVILDNKIVPIRQRDPRVSQALAAAIDRALAPKPEDRYQTAGEFRVALAQAL